MKKCKALLFLAFLLVIQLSHAEYFGHIGSSEGLSQSSVMAIYQDQLGRMWFGTREGINIYSKDKITVYKAWTQQPDEPGQRLLIGNEVSAITGDGNGDVFLIVDRGLLKYDIRKESFRCIRSGPISALTSYQGEIWCTAYDSIFKYNPQTEEVEFQQKTGVFAISYFTVTASDFRLGAHSGLYVAKRQGAVTCLIPKVDVYRIFESSQKELWIACRTQGLYRINSQGKITQVPNVPDSPKGIVSLQVREFVEDRKGNIWFGTFGGLQKYDPRTGMYSLIRQEQRPGGLTHSSIFSLYQDVQGTLWIGSYYGGVNYFNPDNNTFTYYAYNPDRADCLKYPFAGSMVEDKDCHLWICTDGGGLACLDRATDQFTTYTAGGSNALPHNNLKSICYDPQRDHLYIGTHLGGLSRYDRKTGRFHNYLDTFGKDWKGPNDVIFQVAFSRDRLFVSARNGVFMMNPDTNEFRLLIHGQYYQTFVTDSEGYLWLASGREVYRLNPEHPEEVKTIDMASYGCQFNIVKLLENGDGRLYIGTLGSGLYCYDERTGQCTNYTLERNQLVSNYCYHLLQTPQNKILITSDRGVTLFNPKNETFRSIELGNGLSLSSIINGCGAWVCADQRIFIGGTGGITSFQERSLDIEYPEPNLYFSSLSVNNTRVNPDDTDGILTEALPFVRELDLEANQNNLTIEFATSNYIDILNNTWYEYKLEGFDQKWISTSQTSLKYTNLDPGTYVLHVREKGNALNKEKGQEISLLIRISPPWYLTVWAWISYIVLTTSITFFVQRARSSRRTLAMSLERERIEKEHIEELNQAKLRFFTNVSHEFRTPLTLIISQIELMSQNNTIAPSLYNSILKIRGHALQMKRLITELLDFRKFGQNYIQLRLSEQSVNAFLEEIYSSFSGYASQKQIVYKFEPLEEDIRIWMDDWQMKKVFFNLLSNAFKHTPNYGSISISVSYTSEQILVKVKDTGNGIRREEIERIFDRFYQADNLNDLAGGVGTGIGLALTKSIVHLHHGNIVVESVLNEGSCFTVKLPKDYACFLKDPEATFLEHPEEPMIQENSLPDKVFMDSIALPLEVLMEDKEQKRRKVLLVEDNQELLALLEEIFSPLYQVTIAHDGEEGFRLMLAEMPDLIVSDVMMPILTGTEMCLKIKSNLNFCHIPVVLLTALDTAEQSIEGLQRGADDYVTKPFNAKVLLVRCNNLIRSRLLLQNRFAKEVTAEVDLLAVNPMDKAFLDKVINVVDQYIDNEEFDIAVLCRELGVGRTLLHGKFKALIGMTPNEFVLNHRLKKAALLLKNEPHLQIAEISDKLGFGSPRYFTRCFKNHYNTTPVEYRKVSVLTPT